MRTKVFRFFKKPFILSYEFLFGSLKNEEVKKEKELIVNSLPKSNDGFNTWTNYLKNEVEQNRFKLK